MEITQPLKGMNPSLKTPRGSLGRTRYRHYRWKLTWLLFPFQFNNHSLLLWVSVPINLSEKNQRHCDHCFVCLVASPVCSMYGIFANIWHKFMVNVGKYSIHGAYGYGMVYKSQWNNFTISLISNPCILYFPLTLHSIWLLVVLNIFKRSGFRTPPKLKTIKQSGGKLNLRAAKTDLLHENGEPASSKWPFDHPNGGHLTPGKVT